ncbi:hypothetical protein [Marinoscillum luteum]|uniref:Uncharacterized protein n=1 Tax=Marinoscillum luteum TaxID=861051 RepID=A0ABW7N6X6_9BACT
MNCRTRKRKEELNRKFYIQPVNYLKLLNGQHKQGCCGALDDKYYIFSYRPRSDYDAQSKYFFVGTHCANEFLDIIKHDPLPLFNPLIHEQGNHSPGNSNSSGSKDKASIHPFNRELLTATNMLCISWNIIPETRLESVISFTRRRPDNPNYNGIEMFNRIVAKDARKRTLRKMIDELRETNDLKKMRFDLLNQHLDMNGIENHIG